MLKVYHLSSIPVKQTDVKNQWKAIGIFDFKPLSVVYLTYSTKLVFIFHFRTKLKIRSDYRNTSNVSKLEYFSNLHGKRRVIEVQLDFFKFSWMSFKNLVNKGFREYFSKIPI